MSVYIFSKFQVHVKFNRKPYNEDTATSICVDGTTFRTGNSNRFSRLSKHLWIIFIDTNMSSMNSKIDNKK